MTINTRAEKPIAAAVVAEKPAQYTLGYIPALDGWRSISVLLVMAVHEIGPITSAVGHKFNGWISVDIFFLISGFLITSILLKEANKTGGSPESGKFNLPNFYMRRWLRICPGYYFYLGVVMAWYMIGGDHHIKPFVLSALYLANLDIAYGWGVVSAKPFLTHLWTLGIEEQFYLVCPAALMFLKKHAVKAVSLTIVALYFWRLYVVAHGATWIRVVAGVDTRIDVILAGVLLAFLLSRPGFKNTVGAFLGKWPIQLALTALTLQTFLWIDPPIYAGVNEQLIFWGVKMPWTLLLLSALMTSVLCGTKGPFARILSNPILVFTGKLSYSLYLWHPFVHLLYCAYFWNFFTKHPVQAEIVQYALIYGLACASYYLIEQPFLKLKTKYN